MGTKPRKEGARYNPLNDFLFLKTMGEKGDEEQSVKNTDLPHGQ